MEREQLNRIRPGGAEEWKQRRAQGGAGEQKASDPQAPAGERKQPRPQAPAGTHIQILPQPSPVEKKAPQAPAVERKAPQPRLTDEERKAAQDPDEKLKRSYLVKLLIMLVLVGALALYTTIAWFTMNKETGSSGMGVKVQATPYTIQTSGSSGYYSGTYASLGSEGMEWTISASKNFDNHEAAIDTATGETEPGIEPGDYGILEFRVNPNNADSITVDCVFDMTAYVETTTLDGSGNPVTIIREIDNSALLGYLKAHVMLFSGIDESGKYTGLIDNDESLRRVLRNQTYMRGDTTYTQIYWVWPMYLSNLTSHNSGDLIFATSERSNVIAYIARNRNGFFKDCSDSAEQVTADLSTLAEAESSSIYNRYNVKYDNADLEIGNNVSYVMLSMQVKD